MSQTVLPNQDFNSAIVYDDPCLIDPLESYLFGYQGNLEFSYVELTCSGCEFENNSNTYDDCVTYYNSNNLFSACGDCEDCVCGFSNCIQSNGGFSFATVVLNSTDVIFKFYGEVHREVSGAIVIDKYEWEREFNLEVPNVTQIQEISSDRYRAINDQNTLTCTNFNYVWYVNDVEKQNSGNDEFFYPQAPDCEATELTVEIEQSFVGGSRRTGESSSFTIESEESCCLADQSVPTVSNNNVFFGCGTPYIYLTGLHNGQVPNQSVLIWSRDNDASDGLDNQVGVIVNNAGDYYGYYYDDDPGCYSPGVKVTVGDLTVAPSLSTTEIVWDCPNELINLNDYLVGSAPEGTEVIWSKSSTPPPGPGIDPNNIQGARRSYFVFYYDPITDCYSPSSEIEVKASYTTESYEEDHDVTIENDVVLGFVKVGDNTTFTIKNCRVQVTPSFSNNFMVRPNSKLILDNATITNLDGCGDEERPPGIIIIPDFENLGLGQVKLKNGSIIENMEVGISTAWYSDDTDQNDRIIIDKSTIRKCNDGIRVLGWGSSPPKVSSKITDSYFTDNDRGIYYRAVSGLDVESSTFTNNQDAGIVLTNSKATIKGGNSFNGGFAGIRIEDTQPMSSDVLIGDMDEEKNEFKNLDYGILLNGAFGQLASVYAENNEIETPGYLFLGAAFMAWGENSYRFINNKVESGILRSYYSGSGFNRMSCNDIESSIQYFGTNSNSDFLENDIMGSTPVRMNLDLFGTPSRIVRENIGMQNEAAGNCFQGSNKDILNSGPSFNYYYFNNEPCEEPGDPNNSFNKSGTFDPAGRCDGRGLFNLIDPDGDNEAGFDPDIGTINHISESQVLDSINYWIQEVINLGGDDIRTMQVEGYSPISPQLDLANEILNQWLNYALYRSEHEESSFANQIFQLTGSYEWQTREFGYRVMEGDLNTADTILQSLPTADSNQQVFYNTQVLNLKRLEIEDSLAANNYNVFSEDSLRVLYFDADSAMAHGRPYFTETEVANIESMGETHTPSAAYARTLYYQLTGNYIDIPPVESGDNSPELLLGEEDEIREGVNIYPNPFSEDITISMDEPISAISIFGLNGELVKEVQTNNAKVTLRTNELLPGMYFLQIQTKAGQTTRKMIKQ